MKEECYGVALLEAMEKLGKPGRVGEGYHNKDTARTGGVNGGLGGPWALGAPGAESKARNRPHEAGGCTAPGRLEGI
jgi:hypothetical protein